MADFSNAGTALKISDGASPEVYTTIASIMSHGDLSLTRSRLPTTKLSGTVATTKAGLQTVGDLQLEGTYDPSDTQVDSLWTKITTTDQSNTNFQLVLATSPTETYTFAAFVADFVIVGNSPDGLIMFRAVLAIQSVPVVT